MSNYEITGWAKAQDPSTRDMTLPSGQVCQIRNLKMEDILVLGIVNDLDDFGTALAPAQPNRSTKRAGAAAKKAQEEAENRRILGMLSKDGQFDRITMVMNKVVATCVLQPSVESVPENGKREKGKIYVDDIDFMDRLAIFNDVFTGMGELVSFREAEG